MNNSCGNSKRLVVRDLEHTQQYRCVVSNEAGSIRSDAATITVMSKVFVDISLSVLVYLTGF